LQTYSLIAVLLFWGGRVGIRFDSPLPLVVEFATGMINVGFHKTILSDGILPQQTKKEKILSDKIPYVYMHFIMTDANG